ncbi:shikimate kinase [Aliiroseovarius sediminis]|uniref:shikimate kinase n=2 Tax=Aliiroseovarius TaxID=1658781 RepID=UPI002103FAB3|nr:shikimate kinase [Aliiroseovarius sediminis]
MAFPARSRHSGKKFEFGQVDAVLAFKVKKSIVMVGMMGAGKTAVGQAVANRLRVPFLDSDEEIVRAANMSISEIFERDGEDFFRDREAEVIGRLLDTERAVLSTGGGAFMSARNRAMIAERGVAVWLKADLELLWARVRHKDTRPLLRTPDPKATLTQIYDARVPIYAKADLSVAAQPGYSIADMADAVVQALLTRPDVLEET